MSHGQNMVAAIQDDARKFNTPIPRATRAHFWGHRYVKKKEKLKDKVTYHTGVLLEWDHGKYTTIVELAWLRGLGGFGGNSSWCEDSYTGKRTMMWDVMPDCMKSPWDTHRSEIRMIDHVSKDLNEFKQWLKKYDGIRYTNAEIRSSADVRLTFASLDHIAQYLNNYSFRETSYSEMGGRNCQTFAVDFFSFLTAKVNMAECYQPVKLVYKEKRHMFLYDPSLFTPRKKK